MTGQLRLLGARRFLPLFAAQTTGAVEDNLFKSAFVMLVTYGTAMRGAMDPGALAAMAGGALIAPYFLFSATAGELADRFERARLLQILKAAELVTVVAAAAALLAASLWPCFVALFLLGAQAAFSSPVRYALLPQHLAADELVDGNALLEGGTFLAILLGTIAGGLAIALDYGTLAAVLLLVVLAAAGLAASFLVPPAPAPSPGLRLSRNPAAATVAILRQAGARRDVKLSILGASWFWLVGAVFLSQIPAFAKQTLGAGSGVVTLFLAAFSIGVGVGSVLCGRLMRGEVSARYVPLAAFGMAAFSLDLALAGEAARPPAAAELLGIAAFLSRGVGVRIFIDLTAIAICGGLYVVPLYAIIQRRSEEAARARTIAAMNIMNALFMTGAAVVTALLLGAGFTTPDLYLALAVLNIAVALWMSRLLPQDTLRMLVRIALRPARQSPAERVCRRVTPRGRGWRFIDLAVLGSNTWRSYGAAALRIVLWPLACMAVLALVPLPAAWRGVAGLYAPIVAAGAAMLRGLVRSHRRPWRSAIAPDLRIDPRRLAIGGGVELAILAGQLAALHALTGWPWRFAIGAVWPAFGVAVLLIPLQAASEEALFRGYLTQALGRIVRNRAMIVAAVALLFGLLHANAYGPLTLLYFFVLSVVFSLVSLNDERLELAIGGHAAMNLFAFVAAGSGIAGPAIVGGGRTAVPFNGAAVALLVLHGALFYGATRLLVRLFCRPP